jgi:CheY-like chemotaxis protein
VGLRVLLVDDDADLREAVAAALELGGCEVYAAVDVGEARAALASWPPDVLVLDLHGTGDPAPLVRAAAGVPLVLTSGSSPAYRAAAAARLGAAAALAKPYDAADLDLALGQVAGYQRDADMTLPIDPVPGGPAREGRCPRGGLGLADLPLDELLRKMADCADEAQSTGRVDRDRRRALLRALARRRLGERHPDPRSA